MRPKRTLSFLVTTWTALAVALSMGIYAVFQYFWIPGLTVAELVLHHLWHVLALGVIVYVFCRVAFHRILIRPLERIHEHLYGLGMGRLEPLDLETDVREIQSIVSHVNLMLRRMEQGFDRRAIETCQEELRALRQMAIQGSLGSSSPEADIALQHLRDLEEAVLSIIQDAQAARASSREARSPVFGEAA